MKASVAGPRYSAGAARYAQEIGSHARVPLTIHQSGDTSHAHSENHPLLPGPRHSSRLCHLRRPRRGMAPSLGLVRAGRRCRQGRGRLRAAPSTYRDHGRRNDYLVGGPSRNRTDVHGFAVRCIATLPSGPEADRLKPAWLEAILLQRRWIYQGHAGHGKAAPGAPPSLRRGDPRA
jgi:hypothetical protein